MFSPSSSNIDLFLDSIPLSPPYFGHETVLLQSYPNYLLDDVPFMEPISTMEDVSNTLAMTSNQENNNIGLQEEHYSPNESTLSKKIQTMKDRHSKINTAAGLRERRVRLSLGVAIKFFDLQDMLGFDKASKTIDWLLRKSSSSIEELKKREKSCINVENRDDKSSASASECKALSDLTNKDPKKKNLRKNQEKKIKQLVKSSLQLQARESRAKARERARERTKGKMATARVSDKTLLHSRLPILNPFDSFNEIEASNERMMVNNAPINEPYPCSRVSEAQKNSTSENSILMKRQFMKPCSNLNVANSSNVTQNQNIMGASAPELQDSKYLEIFWEAGNHFNQVQDGVQIWQEMQVVVLLEV